jgi:hypothetical protein
MPWTRVAINQRFIGPEAFQIRSKVEFGIQMTSDAGLPFRRTANKSRCVGFVEADHFRARHLRAYPDYPLRELA